MPYLEPAQVLREFSRYAATEIRPAIADDEAFMRGQVGSMASTLRFLAGELEGTDEAVAAQRAALLDALDGAATAVEDDAVGDDIATLRERVASADGDARAVEATVVEAADEALAAVDGLDDEAAARRARGPLYEFLEARVEAQLRLLGRPSDGG